MTTDENEVANVEVLVQIVRNFLRNVITCAYLFRVIHSQCGLIQTHLCQREVFRPSLRKKKQCTCFGSILKLVKISLRAGFCYEINIVVSRKRLRYI